MHPTSLHANPVVSIGMPVYNGESFLPKTLDDLLTQDFEDFELIISDNASTDRTPEICQDRAATDKRIRYERAEVNRGPTFNFNHVARTCRGRYFMWAAHDDRHERSFISKLLVPFTTYDDLVFSCCDYDTINLVNGNIEGHGPISPQLSGDNTIFQNAVIMMNTPHSPFFYGLYDAATLKASRFLSKDDSFDFGDLFLLNEMSVSGKVHFIPAKLFHAGVKDGERKARSFSGRRVPIFRFAYSEYYRETVACIFRNKVLTTREKYYLLNVITNQVLTFISVHERFPRFMNKLLQWETYYSAAVAKTLLNRFSPGSILP